MIDIVLDIYIKKQKVIKKRSSFFILLITILFSIIIASLFVISVKKDTIYFYILSFVAIILFFVWCVFVQKIEIQKSDEKFSKYNESLDLLNSILKDDLKDKNGNAVCWNSEKKLEYLIKEGEERIALAGNGKESIVNYVKTIIFPIIGFLAGLLAKNENADVIIILTIVVLVMVVYCYGVGKIISDIVDMVFKRGSQREMKKLINMLKDLHARIYYQ